MNISTMIYGSEPIEQNEEFFSALARERAYQIHKWGHNSHTVGEWLLIAQKELDEATEAWFQHGGDASALAELVQVATAIMACFEEHEITERNFAAIVDA